MHAVVVTDQPSLHQSLAAVLRQAFGDIDISWARSAGEAVRANLALLDIASGVDGLVGLRERLPRCRIVAISRSDDHDLMLAALRCGAAGYLPNSSSPKIMVAALRLVAAGGKYLPPEVLAEPVHPVRVPVTARQRDVLRLLLKGYSNQRIAAELSISESTVKQHAHAVFDALGVSTRAQLIAAAARGGIAAD
jgi:DNA-binding NarL/FixJ family response regulator